MEQSGGLCLVQQMVYKNQYRGGSSQTLAKSWTRKWLNLCFSFEHLWKWEEVKRERKLMHKNCIRETRLQLNSHKWSFSFISGWTSFSSRNYINLLDAKSNDSKVELISYVAETLEVLMNIKRWKTGNFLWLVENTVRGQESYSKERQGLLRLSFCI